MKRAKKSFWFLAGILLLLGFCFREDVLASSLTSLPSLSKAGIGEVVSSDSVIDGRYDFTPLIGSETKIRFGSTDGIGKPGGCGKHHQVGFIGRRGVCVYP